MSTKKYLYIFFLLVFFNNLKSQTNFLPGYIITNNNDTINGLIDYRGDIRNSKTCSFKNNEKAECISYEPFSIKSYRFIDSKYYISKKVPNTDSLDLNMFVEYLVDGISDLYYYRDHINDYYLISKNGGPLIELTNEEKKVFIDGKEYLKKSNKYYGLLIATFNDCNEIKKEIQKVNLSHKSLIKITKDYHNYVCKDQACIIYEKRLPIIKLQFLPFIGINLSSLVIKNDIFFSNTDYSSDISTSVGLMLLTSLPRLNEKLSLQITTSLTKQYYYGLIETSKETTNEYNDIHIHMLKPEIIFSLKYTYPKGKIRPTIAFGGGQSFVFDAKSRRVQEIQSKNSVNTFEYKDIPIPSRLSLINGSLGLDYHYNKNKIFFINANYTYEIGSKNDIKSILQLYNLNIGIYF